MYVHTVASACGHELSGRVHAHDKVALLLIPTW